MGEKYSGSIRTVQVKRSPGHAGYMCWKHAAIETRRLASLTNHIQIFERIEAEPTKEEVLIIADMTRQMEFGDPADARKNLCNIERTLFRRIGPDFGSLDGSRQVTGLLAVESRCSDVEREAEWHDWYNTVHVPDMLGSGLYHTAFRFEIFDRMEGRGHYLALYETDLDPGAAHRSFWEEFRPTWIRSGRVIETMRVTSAISYAATVGDVRS